MTIYRVTSPYINQPVYFAGYSLDVIKEEAHFSLTDLPLNFELIALEDIPAGSLVRSAGLSRDDARALRLYFDGK